jgi:four helix bundle protein
MQKAITSFKDLHVYQNTYKAMLVVYKDVLPLLPASEKYDLVDQLSRSTKAVPRLIAEGYAKRHQKLGFQKYLDDAMGESNETIVGLEQCRDLYGVKEELIKSLVDTYDMSSRQLYKLSMSWTNFKRQKTNTV